MNTARRVQIRFSPPSGACGMNSRNSTTPTSTGGSAMLTLASRASTLRPRKRPSPIASPIGSPITVAIAVAISDTWSVKPMIFIRYGLPCQIIGNAT